MRRRTKRLSNFLLIAALGLAAAEDVRALNITGASGGGAISADNAANAPTPSWTSLGAITLAENGNGEFAAGSNVTLVLKTPAGFEFNTGQTPNVSFTANRNIASATLAFTDSSTLTVTLTVTNNNSIDTLTIGNTTAMQVRATAATPLATGDHIYRPSTGGGTATISGVTTSADGSTGSNFGNLTEVGGNVTQLGFTTQPASATAGAVFGTQPVVRTQDQFGNNSTNGLAATVTLTMAITSGTGPLQGLTSTNIGASGAKGTVAFPNLRIDVTGSDKQLTASASGLTSDTSSVFSVSPAAANKLVIATQPSATAAAGVAFAQQPIILIQDQFNNIRSNDSLTITAARSGGSGTLQGSTSIGAVNGVATFSNLAHPLANNITIQFTSGGLTSATSSTIAVSAGALSQLQVLLPGETAAPGTATGKTGTPSSQTAGTAFTVTVRAADANYNLLTNITHTVGLSSSDIYATLPANANLVNGAATMSVTARAAGTATMTCSDITDGVTTGTSSSVTVNAGAFTKLQMLLPGETAEPGSPTGRSGTANAQTAGTAFSLTVRAVDANWNLVTNASGSGFTIQITSSDVNATLPSNANLASGIQTFNFTFKTAGAQTIGAADNDDGTKTPATGSLTVNVGMFSKLQLLVPGETAAPGTGSGKTGTPSAQTAGNAFSVTVNAVDANWNFVSNVTDTVGLTSSDAAAIAPPNTALVNGTAVLSITLKDAGTQTITASDVSDGTKTANTSPNITVNAGSFAKLLLLMPGESAAPGTATGKSGTPTARTAGNSFNVTVNSVDAFWNLVSTNDTVHLSSSDSAATLAGNTALSGGTASMSVTFRTSGSQNVSVSNVTHPGIASNDGTSATVNPAAANKLVIATQPSANAVSGVPFAQQPVVLIQDQFGNIRSNDSLTITAVRNAGAGSLSGTTNVAAVSGVASFTDLAHSVATNITIQFNNGSLTSATSSVVSVSSGPFAQLQVLLPGESPAPGGKTGTPTAQTAGTAFNVTVRAVDARFNLLTNITDTVAVTTTDTNASAPSSAALVNGIATFSFTLRTAGNATFTSTDQADNQKAGISSAVTVNAGAFVKLQLLVPGETASPGTASGKTGTPSAQIAGTAFTVRVNGVDANWNVVPSASGFSFTMHITSSDTNAILPSDANLSSGTQTFNVTLRTAGTATITATDTDDGTKTPSTSPAINVNSGAFAKLQVLMPGENPVAGSATGKSGSPLTQTAGTPFNITVNSVDANWNPIATNDTIHLASSDTNAVLPADGALSNGTQTFSVLLKTGGARTVTASNLTHTGISPNTSSSITLGPGAFVKLQLLMPGETASPGSASGKIGTPATLRAGSATNVTVNAVDANWNVAPSIDTVGITSSDASATLPANAALVAGTRTFSVTFKTAGTATATATDITDGTKTESTSPAATVIAGAFAKLQILAPGETAAPGSATGKTGTPSSQVSNIVFAVTVNAVDANWNLISTNDTIRILSSDSNAVLPANAALVAGTRNFNVTLKTLPSATVTASNVTHSGITLSTTPAIPISSGVFAKLQVLLPGETAAPGTALGKTGTASAQEAGRGFYVTVKAVDSNWNLISANDVVQLSSSDIGAILPPGATLNGGTSVFPVTLTMVGTATITSSNLTHVGIAAGTSATMTINAASLRGGPVVAIHDSELTRALEAASATNPGTPTGAGTTGFEWWPTNWHYFVMPEALKEALRADGTAFEIISDADITAGRLMSNGVPRYPIVISLASEAVRDDEIGPLTNYVAAGGTLLVGSSAFTRFPNGAGRGDFALANQMGVHSAATNLQNWAGNTNFSKNTEHRLSSHIPFGTLNWRMPNAAEENSWGISPSHQLPDPSLAWQVQTTDATVLAQGDSRPYLTVKQYGAGNFVYHAGMQPLIGHGGWAPTMYAYGIFKNAIEWAFSRLKAPVARASAWPYAYDAARIVRHDFENYQEMISALETSAAFEATNNAKGDYFFCTGTLRVDMTNSPAVIASLRRAVTNYGATIGPHNGGLSNPSNTNLLGSDYDFWHWGLDEALDVTPAGYPSGKAYALASLSNSFNDVEGWLTGITNSTRSWVAPYFNATRENSYDIQASLGIRITGEQKLTPFPHWTLSTATSGKRYPMLTLPVSDWFVGSQIGQSAEAGHSSATVHAVVDYYYSLGALINLYSHSSSDGTGGAGNLVQDYILHGNSKSRLWSTNSLGIYNWWSRRSSVQITPSITTSSNQTFTSLNIFGATDPQTAVDIVVPQASYSGLQVLTNGVAAPAGGFRTNGQLVRVNIGSAVTNAEVRYLLFPSSQDEIYSAIAGATMTISAPGVLGNDTAGLGTNLTAVLVSGPAHGVLNLSSNGGFTYTADTNFSGADSFTYKANDGTADGQPATVTMVVTPSASVLFSDDFSRETDPGPLAPWVNQAGNWSVTGGQLRGGTNAPSFGYGFAYLNSNWTNYSVDARLRFSSVSAFGGGLGGRLNPASGAHYAAWIYPESSPGGSRLMRLVKFQNWNTFGYNGTNSVTMQQITLPSVGTNWHDVKLALFGNVITVFWDGTQVMSVTDTDAQPYLSGGVSVDMWTDATPFVMSVDNVNVTAPTMEQTITFNQPTNHAYGDVFVAGTTASSGLPVTLSVVSGPATVAGDTITIVGTGIVTIRASQSGDANYKPAPMVERSFTANQATLTVSADNKTKVYAAAVPALTASYSGFVNGETVAVLTGSPTLSTTVSNGSPAGTYPITISAGTLSAVNYVFQFTNGQMTVSKAPLTVTANNASRTYGQTNPVFTASYSGFVNGDNASVLSGSPSLTTSATVSSPIGSYPIVAAAGTLAAANYSFSFSNGTLTISWATVFSDDFIRGSDPGPLSPWIAYSNNWSITGGIMTGGVNPLFNYGFAYITNTWSDYTVEARIQFPAGAFGGGPGGRLDPVTGAHYAAWVYPEGSAGGSSVIKLVKFQSWNAFGYNGTPGAVVQQVSLPGVGTNWHTVKISFSGTLITVIYDGVQYISVTDAEAQPYSSGAVCLDMWTDSSGYTMNVDDVAVSAPPAPQTITFAPLSDRTYGDSSFALTATASSGLPVTFSVLSGPATLSSNMLTLTGAGLVTVRASQAGDINYSPAPDVDRSFTVNPASLLVSADNKSKVYGSTNPVLTGTLTGVVNGDDITASYSTGADTNSPAGNYPILPTLIDPGSKLVNYSVTTNHGTLSVTTASLTATADNKSRLYGQMNPAFTVTYSGFVNGEDAGIVTGTLIGSTTADTNSPVGSYSICVSGQSAPNYTINYVDGTLSVLPTALLVQADDKSRAYGQANPVFTATLSGFVNGENSSVLGGALAFNTIAGTNSPVGTYPIEVSGLLSTNYSITFSNGTLTVTPFALTVTADNHSRAYGAANPILTGTLTGVQNGDNITANYSTTADTNSLVGTYDITPVLNDADGKLVNYSVTTNNGTLTVTQALLSVTVENKSRTYGAANPILTGTLIGIVNADNITANYSTTADTNSPVGSYSILATLSDPDSKLANYLVTTNNGTLTVTHALLSVTADNKSRTYGAANPGLTGTVTGVANNDNITANYATAADTNSPVGAYSITATLNDPDSKLANYLVTTNNGTLSITPASLTGTADNKSRLYGQSNPAFTVTYGGFVNGENSSIVTGTLIGSTSADTNSPVGSYPISVSGQSAPNYTITYVDGTLSVLPAALLVQADNKSRAYGQANPAFTATMSGFVNGENSSALGGTLVFNSLAETNSPVGTYPIEVSGLLSTNYSITFSKGTLTVTPFALTVTADNHTRAYGAANPTLTGTLTGVQNGDNITASYSTTAETNSPVGNYSIVPVLSDPDGKLVNYSVTTNNGTLTVTQAPLSVTADNKSRTYGAANPTLTGTLVGVVNADNIIASYFTTADTNSLVGSYSILAILGDPDSKLANYLVTTNNGTLSITPANLTGAADNKSRLYGQGNPVFTITYSGFVNGEDSSIVNGTLIGSTSADTNSPVGSYPISVSGQSAPNYTIIYVDGTLSVLPAVLLVKADDKSRAYGQANPTFTATLSGFVNGEDSSVLGGALVSNTLAETNSPVGTYPIEVSGLLSTNYSITFSNGTLTVTPFTLTVTADNHSRAYGAVNPTLNGTLIGVQNGDNVTASYSTTAETNSPVGNYSIVPVLSDPDGKLVNYSVTTNNGTLTVTQALLTVTAVDQSKVFSEPNPELTVIYSGFVNDETSSVLSGAPSIGTAVTLGSPAGQYPITVSAGTLSANNYSFQFVAGTFTVEAANSSMLLGSSENPSTQGGSVTFTATLSSVAPATEVPSGSVQFLTNGVALGDPVALVGGVAAISTSLLPPGSNVVQAVYVGNGNFNPSTNNLVQIVNPEAQQPSTLAIHDNGNGTVTIKFSGTPGAKYIVQAAESVGVPGAWTNVSTNTAGVDGVWTYTESKAGQRFFRAGKLTAP